MSRSVLVVVAHPDDEVLGCGATIARHSANGDSVHVLIMAEGLTSRDSQRYRSKYESELETLKQTAEDAAKILGVTSLQTYDFPDNRMDSVDLLDVIKVIESALDQCNPEVVYTHYNGDLNIDHRIVHEAVVTACRPLPANKVRKLLFCEIPSSTEWQVSTAAPGFNPNWYVDVTATSEAKLKALALYESELKPWPHPRSIEAVKTLMKWRGASVGIEAAEAFVVGRVIS